MGDSPSSGARIEERAASRFCDRAGRFSLFVVHAIRPAWIGFVRSSGGHSLVAALRDAGLARLFVTDWRSATAETRFLGIDNYLSDLNVLVDEIEPPVDLIGLCQGGWMALVYAARFPGKVGKLMLAGAPIDTAAPSPLSALADASALAAFHEVVRLGDGLVLGRMNWDQATYMPEGGAGARGRQHAMLYRMAQSKR